MEDIEVMVTIPYADIEEQVKRTLKCLLTPVQYGKAPYLLERIAGLTEQELARMDLRAQVKAAIEHNLPAVLDEAAKLFIAQFAAKNMKVMGVQLQALINECLKGDNV